ncbi:MAG: hypothetical protein KDE28_07840, partial [Anaerolineales bacterium]|nr:hypothetical protein [Anaerolineales bacterium]
MAKSLWKYAPLLIILLSGGIGLSVSYLYNAGAYVNWQPLGSPTVASDEKWGIAYLEPNDASVIVSDGVGTMERGS